MTANLTVPADVWACQRPGVPLVAAIVEGEEPHTRACGWRKHPHGPDCAPGCPTCTDGPRPPAWLVALRDARCDRGCGERLGLPRTDPRAMPCDCDGRLLHDVRVECETCQGTGDDPPSHVEADYHGPCLACETTDKRHPGYRTVRCLVDFVPVHHNTETPPLDSACPCLEVWDDGPAAYWPHPIAERAVRVTPAHVDALAAACGKPPADWVGGYAVIVTTTDQEAE